MEASLTAADSIGLGAEFRFTEAGRGGEGEGGGGMRANLVRGMAYVTVVYEGQTTPVVSSTHAFMAVNGKASLAINVTCSFQVCGIPSENYDNNTVYHSMGYCAQGLLFLSY